MSAFFTLHRDLPREGPGEAADVLWALDQLLAPPGRVADLACGPGADLLTLARALPQARIVGIDRQVHFVAEARARLGGCGDRVDLRQGDMAAPGGPYDLIWSAGAVYFLGIETALGLWRPCLAPGGAIAFSHPVVLSDPAPPVVRAFWAGEGPVETAEAIGGLVVKAGFRTLAQRVIVDKPWADYYLPQETRIAALRPKAGPDLHAVLDEAAREIALWRQAPDEIAYRLSVVAPA